MTILLSIKQCYLIVESVKKKKKNTENTNPVVSKTSNGKTVIL